LLFALYLSLVVQFSMTDRYPSRGQLDYYITSQMPCQHFFLNFFKVFLMRYPPSYKGGGFLILSQNPFLVKYFFKIFQKYFLQHYS